MTRYYAVRVGRKPGIYRTWGECKENTHRHPKAAYKSFDTLEEAEAFLRAGTRVLDTASETVERKAAAAGGGGDLSAPPGHTVVYTDGACQGKPRRAGAGVWFGPRDPRNISAPCPGRATNQRAEAHAILLALRATAGPLAIFSDSQYAINGAAQTHTTTANLDIFEAIWEAMRGRSVVFRHVYGHTGVEGNEGADRLAVAACQARASKQKKP